MFFTDKVSKHALTGKSKNDPTDHCLSLNTCLGKFYLALDVPTFSHIDRISLMCLISKLRAKIMADTIKYCTHHFLLMLNQ